MAPATTTPTAKPSGTLWSVTAKNILNVLLKEFFLIPSSCLLIWMWGTIKSSINKNPIPTKKPIAGISQLLKSPLSYVSIAGWSKLQMDAAIITPDAKPKSIFCNFGFISFFKKNTIALPKVVPASGISNASTTIPDIKASYSGTFNASTILIFLLLIDTKYETNKLTLNEITNGNK